MGYIAMLFGTLPFALPLWNAYLRDWLGRFITVEQIHVLEYLGLGAVAAGASPTLSRPRRTRLVLVGLILWVGLVDEVIQLALPNRVFEWADVRLNWSGALLGFLVVSVMRAAVRIGVSGWS